MPVPRFLYFNRDSLLQFAKFSFRSWTRIWQTPRKFDCFMATTASCCRVCLLTYVRHHLQCLGVRIVKEARDSVRNLIRSQCFANRFPSAGGSLPLHSCWPLIKDYIMMKSRGRTLPQTQIVIFAPPLLPYGIPGLRMSERRSKTALRVAGLGVGGVVESCVTRWLISCIDPRTAAELSCRQEERENYCSSLRETTRAFFANSLYFGTFPGNSKGLEVCGSSLCPTRKFVRTTHRSARFMKPFWG